MDCVQIVFEAVRGASYRGDIAVDDITLSPGPCNGNLSVSGRVCVWLCVCVCVCVFACVCVCVCLSKSLVQTTIVLTL